MFSLILLVIVGLGFGYFATQNTQQVTLMIINNSVPSIPLYIVMGITLLIGFGICWIISLSDTFSSFLTIRGKNNTIKDSKKTIQDLSKKVKELEIENAKLQTESKRQKDQSTSQ
jgi:putative membrane protein